MMQEDLDTLLEACKPVPMIALQCGTPASPQSNANDAWKVLGEKMGFDHMTVVPSSKGRRFFRAEEVDKPDCDEPSVYEDTDESKVSEVAAVLEDAAQGQLSTIGKTIEMARGTLIRSRELIIELEARLKEANRQLKQVRGELEAERARP